MNDEVKTAVKAAQKRVSQLGVERRELKTLVRAVSETEAKRIEERNAWIEFYKAECAYEKNIDRTKADALLADVKHKQRVLVVLGVPSEVFGN